MQVFMHASIGVPTEGETAGIGEEVPGIPAGVGGISSIGGWGGC
jgi:hypothetical protein